MDKHSAKAKYSVNLHISPSQEVSKPLNIRMCPRVILQQVAS